MNKSFKVIAFFKNLLMLIPVTLIFHPFSRLFLFLSYFNSLLVWIYKHKKNFSYTQPLTLSRNYGNRYNLYKYISDNYAADEPDIIYLEFGVAGGSSLKWWINENRDDRSLFFGFDTFEGLPEDWGLFFKKGDMSHNEMQMQDGRMKLVKGLFQDTLFPFTREYESVLTSSRRKIIHMDADLYTSTLFVLSQLQPYLRTGDIILFDEFSVPLHEFRAFKDFTQSFYVKLKPLGAVNNFLQTAFIVE